MNRNWMAIAVFAIALSTAGTTHATEGKIPGPPGVKEPREGKDLPEEEDPHPHGTSCKTTDGDVCKFRCVAGYEFHLNGYNNNGYFDYDGFADCGGVNLHCRAANGQTGCSASGVAKWSDSDGRCHAYNDWGTTEFTTCWGDPIHADALRASTPSLDDVLAGISKGPEQRLS